ncbi:MAG: hypothetical protein FWE62_02805 [Firmicutes bacterium]|nr:hypothetical protein [Bacillota bacterium]
MDNVAVVDVLMYALQAIITAAVPVLTGFAVKYLQAKAAQAKAETDCEIKKQHISSIEAAIVDAVNYTGQTFVRELKELAAFDDKHQRDALYKATFAAKSILPENDLEYMKDTFGDVDAYIRTKIEAKIGEANAGAV